jgi:hypothetical protein
VILSPSAASKKTGFAGGRNQAISGATSTSAAPASCLVRPAELPAGDRGSDG